MASTKHDSVSILVWGLHQGAFANLAAALANGFARVGIGNVSVVFLSKPPGRTINPPHQARLVSLGVSHSRNGIVQLARYLRAAKPPILLSLCWNMNLLACLGRMLSNGSPTKLIVSEHATMSYKCFVEHRRDLRHRVVPRLARMLYPLADGLCANSEQVLDDLLRRIGVPFPAQRTAVIDNPIDVDAIREHAKSDDCHPWLREKTSRVIVCVARLARQKNLPLLLRTLKLVRAQIDVRLVVVGDGPLRDELQRKVQELGLDGAVDFPGASPNPWKDLARADVFVLPSEEEAFGMVLVEAMACGVPVVATDAMGGGPRRILGANSDYGILVRPDDPTALADAILRLLASPDLHDTYVRRGEHRCLEFKPETVARQWLEFFDRL
jgi:glycosyltransferase involved in cell wall biosynthesis